jgi:hypothetical protein
LKNKSLGRFGYRQRSYLSRVSYQAIRDIRKRYPEQEDSDVEGAMELHTEEEATWEREEELKVEFRNFFVESSESHPRDSFQEGYVCHT